VTSPAPIPSHPPAPPADRPSLLPREHGAYGQLAMPLVTGLAIARPTAASFALAAAFVLAFVAHEPMLVLLGQRGRRLLGEEGPRAARLLAGLGLAAAATGVLGVALAPRDARLALLAPIVLGIVVSAFVWKRLEKTAAGEILVAATFAACGAVVALAGDAPRMAALAVGLAWLFAFTAATLSVRAVLRRLKTKGAVDRRPAAAVAALAIVAMAWILSSRLGLAAVVPLSLVPIAVASLALAAVPVAPRQLKTVGWAIVATSVLTLLVLVIGLRGV
jgi:hypothetical protein